MDYRRTKGQPVQNSAPAPRSLGDNIGSEKWLTAQKKREHVKKYADELKRFNKMVKDRKDAKKSRISEPVGGGASDIGPLAEGEVSKSDFARDSNFSFASGAFSNNLKGKAKSIRDKQMEYAQVNVPKPKPRKQWKQDLSHLDKLPGTHILPRAPSTQEMEPKKR
mmetsp:Transcript_24637/g.32972  ORF Transcript_24637/g.32972 Transcript_24637/m.32972 type:complete len:165 (+) Transcript_24637:459-953(+)